MGHTQLKIGVQGGHVEHRGEIEVKVAQSGGQRGIQKNKKCRWKKKEEKKRFLVSRPLTKIEIVPNQEDSESLPSNHMYLRKGSVWKQEVDLCII